MLQNDVTDDVRGMLKEGGGTVQFVFAKGGQVHPRNGNHHEPKGKTKHK